ncbi:hypothetical protein OF83DRAFT_1029380, partial [Amylostereum chailletii]
LLAYIDDTFSHDLSPRCTFYEPYGAWLPPKQVQLLQLWDFLGIPHEKSKQEFGRVLVITGFEVSPVSMTIFLSAESISNLVTAIHAFIDEAPDRRRRLVEWQRLLGWMNWALNVAPLLRPALASSYAKISGKKKPNAPIFLNGQVSRDLRWFATTLQQSSGIHIIRARLWDP